MNNRDEYEVGHDPATLDRFTRVDGPPGAEVAVIGKLGS